MKSSKLFFGCSLAHKNTNSLWPPPILQCSLELIQTLPHAHPKSTEPPDEVSLFISPSFHPVSSLRENPFTSNHSQDLKHKRTGRKNLGGCPTQSPSFTNIFAPLGQNFARVGLSFENLSKVGGLPPPSPPRTLMI